MKSIKNLILTGLAAIVIGGCEPNLSTPEKALNSYFYALEEKDVKKLMKVLPSDCRTLRESKFNELSNFYEIFIRSKKDGELLDAEINDGYDSWADVTIHYYTKDKGDYFAFQLIKEADGKWKVVTNFTYMGNYLFTCDNRR